MMNWAKTILEYLSEISMCHPRSKITLQVSPLMLDYSLLKIVEPDKRMKAQSEADYTGVFTIFGYPVEVVDAEDVPTFAIKAETEGLTLKFMSERSE
jgi:hypothetical protein